MNDDDLVKLLKVQKPEAFWNRQKNSILFRLPSRRRLPRRTWTLAPAFAAALTALFIWKYQSQAPEPVPSAELQESTPLQIPPAQDWSLLEKLDLLENMDAVLPPHQEKS